MSQRNEPDVMTVAEAARYLRVSETKVRAWIADGSIPAITGGVVRISRAALDKRMGCESRVYSQAELDRVVEQARAAERARILLKLVEVLGDMKGEEVARQRAREAGMVQTGGLLRATDADGEKERLQAELARSENAA